MRKGGKYAAKKGLQQKNCQRKYPQRDKVGQTKKASNSYRPQRREKGQKEVRTSSAKAKGRRLCARIKQLIHDAFPQLEGDDIRVTPSGVNGPDLQLSPRAKFFFPYDIEAKNTERLNIWQAIEQSKEHGEKPIVVFSRNRSKTYVVLEIEEFMTLVQKDDPLRA